MGTVLFKGKKTKIGTANIKVGDVAPAFELVDKELNNKSLDAFKNRTKVFWVVPSLDTPVCLTSSKKLNDLAKTHKDVVFCVISADLPFAQSRMCGVEKLDNITALSMMRNKKFGLDYGILIEEGPIAGLLARSVFVVDKNNKISHMELVAEITQEPNYLNLEAALK
ncbi:MAG: thiol peroxidase [Chlamydiales bacterium]|nr:thiol peroxidase [Chlamydiales bacterium]